MLETPMANIKEEGQVILEHPIPSKMFCLYDLDWFMLIPVSTEMTLEEFRALSLPEDHVPDQIINPLAMLPRDIRRSVVSVGSTVYCIGGLKIIKPGAHQLKNEVTKFHVYQPTFKLESCCDMIQPRASPAVVSICGKICVFGRLSFGEENGNDCPWAEFLDTNEPESEQKWKPLKEPPFRLSKPFAVQYEAQTILIGSSSDMKQGAVIYNMADPQSSPSYYKFDAVMSDACVTAPVTTLSTKTMYWIDGMFLRAYELDTHVHYQGSMHDVFPDFDSLFTNTMQGPVLVHLKGDLFNMFTIFSLSDSYGATDGLVECIKLKVTKYKLKSGEGVLQVDRVGYKSYKSELMWKICGALPIAERQS